MSLRLFVIVSVAGLALGYVYQSTFGIIEKAKQEKLENAISQVVPEFDKIESKKHLPKDGVDSLVFYEASMKGKPVGTAIMTYSDKGFGGRIRIIVGYDTAMAIVNTAVLEHKETPGLGDKMDQSKSSWSKQFIGKKAGNFKLKVKKDGGDVDAITAATISSRAFTDAVQRAQNCLIEQKTQNHE